MPKPSEIYILEYALEGLNTLIGTGTGYEYPDIICEYEKHRAWVEKRLNSLKEKEKAHAPV